MKLLPLARTIALAIVTGLITGAATQLGQRFLPDALQPIANSISPWLTVGFVVASLAVRPIHAAVAGFLVLAFALVGYYVLTWTQFGIGGSTSAYILWGAATIAGGFVFGPAGWAWRSAGDRLSACATGLLAAVYIGEAAYLYAILQPQAKPAVLVFVVVGLAIPMLLARRSSRLLAYAAILPALVLAAVGYGAMLTLGSLVAGI